MSAKKFRPMRGAAAGAGLPVPSEHAEQAHVMEWAAWQERADRRLANLFAIGNGGLRPCKLVDTPAGPRRISVVGRKLKSEGVKEGVPDLFLAWPCGGMPGLFIEMKRVRGGSLSAAQKRWHAQLVAAGYAVVVCRGAAEALNCLRRYLNGGEGDVGNES